MGIDTTSIVMLTRCALFHSEKNGAIVQHQGSKRCVVPCRIPLDTKICQLPPQYPSCRSEERIATLSGMNSAFSINSNYGNVTDSYKNVWNNCDISVADEKRAVLEWLSPLEPRERHQAIGMGRVAGVGDWLLLTNEFIQWNRCGDGTVRPVLFCYGDPGVGKTYLRY